MHDKSQTSRMGSPIPGTLGVQKWRVRKFLFVFAVTCILGTSWLMVGSVFAQGAKSQKQPDFLRLEGRWVRPDGGYILELKDIEKDGNLTAAYFNPRPINVFGTKWSRKGGKINLYVELRDVNYPGSKYNLQYDAKSDRLMGTYFQAVEKQTFNIEFVRAK